MKPLGAWVSVLALFLVGLLLGGLAVHLVHDAAEDRPRDRPARERPPRDGRPPRPAGGEWLERLDLTAAQREEIERIRAESRAEAERLRAEWEPRLRDHLAETRARIEAVLTEEQRETFRELRERHRGRAERYFLGDRPHRPRRARPPAE